MSKKRGLLAATAAVMVGLTTAPITVSATEQDPVTTVMSAPDPPVAEPPREIVEKGGVNRRPEANVPVSVTNACSTVVHFSMSWSGLDGQSVDAFVELTNGEMIGLASETRGSDAAGNVNMANYGFGWGSTFQARSHVAPVGGESVLSGWVSVTLPADCPPPPPPPEKKILVCHRDQGNPEWKVIEIVESALPVHLSHQWGEDIYPVPADGCPKPPPVCPEGSDFAGQPVSEMPDRNGDGVVTELDCNNPPPLPPFEVDCEGLVIRFTNTFGQTVEVTRPDGVKQQFLAGATAEFTQAGTYVVRDFDDTKTLWGPEVVDFAECPPPPPVEDFTSECPNGVDWVIANTGETNLVVQLTEGPGAQVSVAPGGTYTVSAELDVVWVGSELERVTRPEGCVPPPPPVCPEGSDFAGQPVSEMPDRNNDGVVSEADCNNPPDAPPPPPDVCPNIDGNQSSVPAGMVKDAAGNCVVPPPPPVCPEGSDFAGQPVSEMPDRNNDGVVSEADCNNPPDAPPPPPDVCPNIDGNQSSVPAGMVKDAAGNCVVPPAGNLPVTGGSTTSTTAIIAIVILVAGIGLFGASFLKRRPMTVKV